MTDEQRQRLQHGITQLTYGNVLPKGFKFNMGYFADGDLTRACKVNVCGTSGCLAGSLSYVYPKPWGQNWHQFSKLFTKSVYEWDWCFSGYWEGLDDTLEGACKRAQYLLDNGLPKGFRDDPSEEWVKVYQDTEVKR